MLSLSSLPPLTHKLANWSGIIVFLLLDSAAHKILFFIPLYHTIWHSACCLFCFTLYKFLVTQCFLGVSLCHTSHPPLYPCLLCIPPCSPYHASLVQHNQDCRVILSLILHCLAFLFNVYDHVTHLTLRKSASTTQYTAGRGRKISSVMTSWCRVSDQSLNGGPWLARPCSSTNFPFNLSQSFHSSLFFNLSLSAIMYLFWHILPFPQSSFAVLLSSVP